MMLGAIVRDLGARGDAEALIDAGGAHSYATLAERMAAWDGELAAAHVPAGAVISIEGDFGIDTVAAVLAAAERRGILVPLSRDSAPHIAEFLATAEVEWRIDAVRHRIERTAVSRSHPLYATLDVRGVPGLVLFSSGSTGRHKAVVHDLRTLAAKFEVRRSQYRTLVFLQPDHIGGVNTLFYTLSNGGTAIVPMERSPEAVCRTIAAHRVELLPTTPTFLNLLLIAYDPERHDLSSLKLITYGTEPMQASTLRRLREGLPAVPLQQTYGLTELGILRSRSRPDGSLWVKVGGEGFDVTVVDQRLFIKADSAMLGYLNAPSPFTADGYFDTGDAVEVDGEWVRILGRTGELINVGGNKVYPAEVEDVLLQIPNVDDAAVMGEPHPLMGQIVVAHVKLHEPEPLADLKARIRLFCLERLPPYKIPSRIVVTDEPLHGARFKKQRRPATV